MDSSYFNSLTKQYLPFKIVELMKFAAFIGVKSFMSFSNHSFQILSLLIFINLIAFVKQ